MSGLKSRSETLHGNALPFECVALLLQGGGALGAYQAGVYEGLHAAKIEPDWIAGISIGAINSAIIAGNAPEHRLDRLHEFWDSVSDVGDRGWSDLWSGWWQGDTARGYLNQVAASRAMFSGVPGFYTPRSPPPYLLPAGAPGATSWYDTANLKSTLERLVDFDRINAKAIRFSVGAVNVRTGNFAYFDTETHHIRAEHVMASGALPPAFDAVEIDGDYYWDGGLVSNTPLDWVLSSYPLLDTLAFQVDLWSASGHVPRDLAEVAVRIKEVQFSSRTRASTEAFRRNQALRGAFNTVLAAMPPELAATPEARLLAKAADPGFYAIAQLIYHSPTYEGQSKDYEFSRATMLDHWAAGLNDCRRTLAHSEVLQRPKFAHAVEVYDFSAREHPHPATKDPNS